MNAKKEQTAILYLENVTVEAIDQSQYGWRVRVKLERENRQGMITRWYTCWFRERPEGVEVGWTINASGYVKAKGWVDDAGHIHVDVSLAAARLLAASPPEAPDPWEGSNEEGWR